MNSDFTTDRRINPDRRNDARRTTFPFFDSEQTLIREDRRRNPDRRISKIEINDTEENTSEITRLFLWYKDDICELFPNSPQVIVGRSPNCEIIFYNRYTSRLHAKFIYEDGEFTITDHSTNGTYIKNDEGEIFLMGERMILHGSGIVSLGTPIEFVEKDVIHYFCP